MKDYSKLSREELLSFSRDDLMKLSIRDLRAVALSMFKLLSEKQLNEILLEMAN